MPSRSANTLIELVVTLALLAIAAAVAVPNIVTIVDRLNVRAAAHEVTLGLWTARNAASMRGENVQVTIDAGTGRIHALAGDDTIFTRDLTRRRGVRLAVTRTSIAYAPTGLGIGAANTTIVVTRGRRADTVTTSRLGRVAIR
ncbi:MAG: prepilin-type N-terminal cleavage/methylation domain-containing protein [Gemmatimonadaceae bacterium]|nr:prepilin-type N-terminal cleavage/methylation domain-containing protein [Gemmatimonadaceae bacterium]